MAQIIPRNTDWQEAFRNIGAGVSEGYQNRSDENAVRSSIEKLGANPKPQDVLNAILKTNGYSPKAKQQALSNYLGVEQFSELQRHAKEQEAISKEQTALAQAKKAGEEAEKIREQEKADNIIDQLPISEDQKKALKGNVSFAKAESLLQDSLKPKAVKKDDKKKSILNGINSVDKMIALRTKGNLGIGSDYTKYLSADTARDFGSYEQLGKSLIQLSTTIPIRNRSEFETLAHKLYDPTVLNAESEGMLARLKEILIDSVAEDEVEEEAKPERKPLSEFKKG